jgi:hypothetical protein
LATGPPSSTPTSLPNNQNCVCVITFPPHFLSPHTHTHRHTHTTSLSHSLTSPSLSLSHTHTHESMCICRLKGWNIGDWSSLLYTDLPSKQSKLCVKDRTVMKCNEDETRTLAPAGLQVCECVCVFSLLCVCEKSLISCTHIHTHTYTHTHTHTHTHTYDRRNSTPS